MGRAHNKDGGVDLRRQRNVGTRSSENGADLSTAELTPIAERIRAHLQRFEADPVINAPQPQGGMMLTPFYNASAYAERKNVHVQYILTHGHTRLSGEEAVRYLQWLDDGGIGSHRQMQATVQPNIPTASVIPPLGDRRDTMTLPELLEELEVTHPEEMAGFERRHPLAMELVVEEGCEHPDDADDEDSVDALSELAEDLRSRLRI
jgi:hypothetical protein